MAAQDLLSSSLMIVPPGGTTGSASLAASAGAANKSAAKTAEDFEAMVLSEFISGMFTTQDKGLFSAGPAGEIYRALLTQEYGKAFAKAGGIGLARQLQNEIVKLQEVRKS